MAEFLVFDIETLDEAPPAAVIEIGWAGVHLDDRGPVLDGRYGDMLFGIPKGQKMGCENRAVHHISPDELEGLPLFDATEWVAGLDDTDYLVAHNAEFERQWLEPLGLPWICTYKCALRAWPDAPKHSNQALKYWLCHEDSPDYYPPHRALPDARVTAQHLRRLLMEHPVETLVRWTQEPKLITRFPFGKHKGDLISEVPADYLRWIEGPKFDGDADLKHWCRVELEKRQ